MKKSNVEKLSYSVGAILLGLALLVVSCGMIEPSSPPPPVATITPPLIPHSIEGRSDCRVCHESGLGGAPRFPTNHSARPNDVCRTCHVTESAQETGASLPTQPVPPAESTAKEISAPQLYSSRCAGCHGVNREGVPGLAPSLTPDSLAALDDSQTRYVISDGRTGTAMPPFKASLSPEEIDALLKLIKSPVP